MKRKEHLLIIAMEECAETTQRLSKALRFGLTEVEAGQGLTNAERIVYEFSDLYAMMVMLYREEHIPGIFSQYLVDDKQLKVEKWLNHSEANGTLTEN